MIVGGYFNPLDYGADSTGTTDSAAAIQDALDAADAAGGGCVFFPAGTYLIDDNISLTSTNSIRIDGDAAILQLGPSFFPGGANYQTYAFTFQGNAPTTVSINKLYPNFATLNTFVNAKKGDRVNIYDSNPANSWYGAGKDYVPSMTAFIDYADETGSRLNWIPEIDFYVAPAVAGVFTELDKTNIVIRVFNQDIYLTITNGVKFVGGVEDTVGGSAAAGYGLYLRYGRFDLNCDLEEVGGIRADGCELIYQGNILGAYQALQTNGLKVDGPAILRLSNSRIMNCRHAVQIGGGQIWEVSAYVDNCEFGSSRATFNENTYQGNALASFDLHGNAKYVYVNNTNIYEGLQQAAGKLYLNNCLVKNQSSVPLFFYRDSNDPASNNPNNCEFHIQNSQVLLAPRQSAFDASPPAGSGLFSSDVYFARDFGLAGGSGWIFSAVNTLFSTEDKTRWGSNTDLIIEPGQHNFELVEFVNCRFDAQTSNIRTFKISPRAPEAVVRVMGCVFQACGLTIGNANAVQDWNYLEIKNNFVENVDTSGSLNGSGIFVFGLENSVKNLDVIITNNHVVTQGATAGIGMNSCPSRTVKVFGNEVRYVGSATLGYGIRSHRNQTASGSITNFVAHVDGNTVTNLESTNTITTGIEILGLNAVGGTGLPAGFYATGNNAVKVAGTDITTTGSAITTV